MRLTRLTAAACLVLPLAVAQPQGKGQGTEKNQGQSQAKGSAGQERAKGGGPDKSVARDRGNAVKLQPRGNAERPGNANIARGNPGRGNDKSVGRGESFGGEVVRTDFRAFAASNKHGQRLAGRAVAMATKRGFSGDDFVFTPIGSRMQVLNRSGLVLLDLDDDRPIGSWQAVTTPFRDRDGAPSFCRSGAGHPVWGRQWCVDKGFGLGHDGDLRWTRIVNLDNVLIRQPATTGNLARDVLLGVLGDIVVNRLATQAITLGYVEPLSGRWIGEPTGPRVLLVSSADRPVAEFVDIDRDDRADLLLVAARP